MNRPSRPTCRLRKCQRLIRTADFDDIYALNRRYNGRCMVLWIRAGKEAAGRVGVVASRRVGGAIQRNRAKRRLREAFRLHRHGFHGSDDVVLVARAHVVKAPWADVCAELVALARKAGLMPGSADHDR